MFQKKKGKNSAKFVSGTVPKQIKLPSKQLKIQQIKLSSLFNLTQDGRHLTIVDLRTAENYNSSFIRKSFNLANEDKTTLKNLVRYFQDMDKKSSQNENKYKIKRIRRLVIVYDNLLTE